MVWPTRLAIALLFFTSPLAAQSLTAPVDAQRLAAPESSPDQLAPEVLPDKPTPLVQPDEPAPMVQSKTPAPRGNLFTRPFYDTHVTILAEIDAGAAIWDDLASRRVIERGGFERNPLMRPFVHTPGTLAVETISEVWVVAFLGDRMKHSDHPLLRKTWWLPQALNISAKLYGGINSTAILRRSR
jgi:hypothetical protein